MAVAAAEVAAVAAAALAVAAAAAAVAAAAADSSNRPEPTVYGISRNGPVRVHREPAPAVS